MHDPWKRGLYKGTVARDPSFMKRIPRRANRRAAAITTAYRHKVRPPPLFFSPVEKRPATGLKGISLLPPRFPNSREIEPKVGYTTNVPLILPRNRIYPNNFTPYIFSSSHPLDRKEDAHGCRLFGETRTDPIEICENLVVPHKSINRVRVRNNI